MTTRGSNPLSPGRPGSGTDAAEPGVATRHDDGPPPAPVSSAAAASRYEFLDEIARGGLGVVYRARDTVLGREVAVKVLQDRFEPDSATARRFLGEARIAAQLQHPGIPPIHDAGTRPDGRPFLAMKLIKGRTLDRLLRDRPDPAADRGRFVAAFEQVCQALAFAHARRVIHRDLKPDNVMVGAFGEVQVMDWGLAKVLGDGPRPAADPAATTATVIRPPWEQDGAETQAGSVLGTPPFMPPEQAAGAVDEADERSDVFGLGAILAVILTDQPPFVADTAEATRVMAAQGRVEDCFRRLDESGAEPDLVALCKRCLAADKADRPRDAGEVAAAVAALRAAADERARRAELDRARAEAEAREQRKRRRVQAALGAVVLAAAALCAVVLWREDRRASQERQDQAAARGRLAATLDRAAAALPADRLADADAALGLAADLLDPVAAPDLRDRYDDLRADRATVVELDKVWARANVLRDDRSPGRGRRLGGLLWFDEDAARTGYPAALANRGLAVGKTADLTDLADRMARSAIRDRLVAALDDWLPVAAADDRPWLCDLLARVDPDPARNEVRRAHAEPQRLQILFARPLADEALRLAARAALSDDVPEAGALAVLRTATIRYPTDFRTQYAAGVRAVRSDRAAAAGYFRAAAALRPDDLAVIYGLGFALYFSGRENEAVPYFLRVTEINPGFRNAYIHLADAIKLGADRTAAVAHFRRAIDRDPRSAMAHFGLGMALREDPEQRSAAIEAFRQSIALDDRFATAHHYLGYVLNRQA
ncbi:MAG TPA: serine/threonine-protein kinase, partial [Gemmataceae bacterium]